MHCNATRAGAIALALATVLATAGLLAASPVVAGSPPAGGAGAIQIHPVSLPDPVPCMTQEEWAELRARAERNLARLEAEFKLPPIDRSRSVVLEWPLRPAAGFTDLGYHATINFVDHDPAYPNHLLDYSCGERTYDNASGVNHNGTDYALWPFSWYKQYHSQVEIVAAAAGTIIDREDGNFDQSCDFGGSSNMIAIIHSDGTRAWYLHMKKWSVTPKGIGETVVTGEYLGVVGSSGSSTGPHLHFGVRDENWDPFDPYGGPCNPSGPASWWSDQRPYFDSAINALLTHSAHPIFPPCPEEEILFLENEFSPGDSVFYGIYHRDIVFGQVTRYAVLDPVGAVVDSGSYSIQDPFYAAAAGIGEYGLPVGAPAGTWKVVVDYDGEHYEHPFVVLPTTAVAEPDAGLVVGLYAAPSPFDRASGIFYTVPSSGSVTLAVYNAGGRRVRTLADRHLAAGEYRESWDGRDDDGHPVASGVYFVRLELRGIPAAERRIVFLK